MKKIHIILLILLVFIVGYVTTDSLWLNNRQDYMSFNSEPIDNSNDDELLFLNIA